MRPKIVDLRRSSRGSEFHKLAAQGHDSIAWPHEKRRGMEMRQQKGGRMKLEFTADWASRHFPKWAEVLAPFKNRPASAFELGSYEGRSVIWFLQNILTHPESRLTCIDSWRDADIHRRFLKNIIASEVFPRCEVRKGDTQSLLRDLRQRFDFINVDAGHRAPAVLSDAVISWRQLNTRGLLIFDDYLRQHPDG